MSFNLQNIVKVVETAFSSNVNVYLDSGWCLISAYTDGDSHYILGWDKEKGEINFPDPSAIFDPNEEFNRRLEDNPLLKDFLEPEE